jgi:RNA polymerase primary sigma factor
LDDNSLKMHLEKGLEKLPDLPKTIIKSRLGINNEIPLTLQQLAEIYGITRERVRQIEKKIYK